MQGGRLGRDHVFPKTRDYTLSKKNTKLRFFSPGLQGSQRRQRATCGAPRSAMAAQPEDEACSPCKQYREQRARDSSRAADRQSRQATKPFAEAWFLLALLFLEQAPRGFGTISSIKQTNAPRSSSTAPSITVTGKSYGIRLILYAWLVKNCCG